MQACIGRHPDSGQWVEKYTPVQLRSFQTNICISFEYYPLHRFRQSLQEQMGIRQVGTGREFILALSANDSRLLVKGEWTFGALGLNEEQLPDDLNEEMDTYVMHKCIDAMISTLTDKIMPACHQRCIRSQENRGRPHFHVSFESLQELRLHNP